VSAARAVTVMGRARGSRERDERHRKKGGTVYLGVSETYEVYFTLL
jgi:hypothetical protein